MALELPTTNGAWQYGRVQYAKRSKKKSKNSDKLILIVQNSYIYLNSEHRMRAGLAEINGSIK